MKTKIKVRKIPTEDILDVLLEMRELGVEFVDFECELTQEKDIIHVTEYRPGGKLNLTKPEQSIDYEPNTKEHMQYIKKIINGHGSN